MPLRAGEFRVPFDPDADAGLPRPFLLGDTVNDKPILRHSLAQPAKKPRGPKPINIPPYDPLDFWTLPDKDKRYRNIKQQRQVIRYFTKKQIDAWSHVMKGPLWGWHYYVNYVHGKVAAGVYTVTYDAKGNVTRLDRAPDYAQRIRFNNEKALRAAALYYWRHDRHAYWGLRQSIMAQRNAMQDAHRRAYDDWAANARNANAKAKYDFQKAWREYQIKGPRAW